MSEYPPEELPAHDQLADNTDTLSWDRERDGRMAYFAVEAEEEIRTEPA